MGLGPQRGLPAAASHPQPIASELVVKRVEGAASHEARFVDPALDGRSAEHRRDRRRQRPPNGTEPGVELSDVVEQGRGEPARVAVVLGAGQGRLRSASYRDRFATVGEREPRPDVELFGPEHPHHPGAVAGEDGQRHQRREEAADEMSWASHVRVVHRFFDAHAMHMRAVGIASRRASAIGRPHDSHVPYPSASSLPSA